MARSTLTVKAQENSREDTLSLTGDFDVQVSKDGSLSVYDRELGKDIMPSGLVFAAPPGLWRDSSITPRERPNVKRG